MKKLDWALKVARHLLEDHKNSTVDKKERRKQLRCSICPPNKGENAKRRAKRGAKKPRKKDHR